MGPEQTRGPKLFFEIRMFALCWFGAQGPWACLGLRSLEAQGRHFGGLGWGGCRPLWKTNKKIQQQKSGTNHGKEH